MYGTTEEVFFTNWDFVERIGIKQCYCKKAYTTFNPEVENGTNRF
jgi:hypothetical protein